MDKKELPVAAPVLIMVSFNAYGFKSVLHSTSSKRLSLYLDFQTRACVLYLRWHT